jgi:hypothetical protein
MSFHSQVVQSSYITTLQHYLSHFTFENTLDLRLFACYVNDLRNTNSVDPIPHYFPPYLQRDISLLQALAERIHHDGHISVSQKETITEIFFSTMRDFARKIDNMTVSQQSIEVAQRKHSEQQREQESRNLQIIVAGFGH